MLKFQKNIVSAAVAVVAFWLCAFSVAHAWGMLSGDQSQLLDYQNVLSKEPKEALTTFVMMGFRLVGLFLGIGALLILASLFLRREFRQIQDAVLLKWALLSFVIAGTIYGGLMRIVSNQQGAALLFFFSMLLYLVLYSLVGQRTKTNGLFNSIVLLPLYAILLYTMGMPGWAKIFGGDQVINRYVNMFSQSFIADLPGGTALMIYILGILELAVPAFLTISLASGELNCMPTKYGSTMPCCSVSLRSECFVSGWPSYSILRAPPISCFTQSLPY